MITEATETYALVVLLAPGTTPPLQRGLATWQQVYAFGLPSWRDARMAGSDWVKALNAPAADLDPDALIRWWTDRLNALYTEATDLGRYRSPDGFLDARNAYRELRTLDRIIANCVRIQMDVEDHAGRVSAAFEFFDLLPNLLHRPPRSTEVWSTLCAPGPALKTLKRSFREAPEQIRTVLSERAEAVTDLLRDEMVEGVVPGRRDSGGVRVGDPGKIFQFDQYIAKVLHQLRNTHHGYELAQEAQRNVLDTHTGHVSVAFPEMVVLYTLAVVSDPGRALGGEWFD